MLLQIHKICTVHTICKAHIFTYLLIWHMLIRKGIIMTQSKFIPVTGTIQQISHLTNDCCSFLVTIRTNRGITNLTLSPSTYVIDNVQLRSGMQIIGFYDANAPVALIFPPQFRAIVIGRLFRENIAFNFFDEDLVALDHSLALNLRNNTQVITANGQRYTCSVGNRLLIVFYTITTRSVPPQTTPKRIIVIC